MHTPATDGEPDAVEYRGKVRPRDRDTSWDAASAQTNTKTGALQALLYEILRERGPRTHDELMLELDGISQPYSPSGVRTRMRELELAGWVREQQESDAETGRTFTLKRPSRNGHPATVWRAVLDDEPAPAPREPEAPTVSPADEIRELRAEVKRLRRDEEAARRHADEFLEERVAETVRADTAEAALAALRSATAAEAGLAAARRLAEWEIGDASWGSRIVGAYLDPEATNRELDEEMSA